MRQTVSKLVECGFLFNKVRRYADSHSSDSTVGLLGQVSLLYVLAVIFKVAREAYSKSG